MRLGIFGINFGACTDPQRAATAVRVTEEAGFDSVWAGEHVILPDPRVPPSPMEPSDPVVDPLLALTWAAAHTSRVRLATGIVILPQRNPVVLAKQVASLDVLSGGRFTLGIGVGYLQPEFEAIGADFANRGPITDEYLEAMECLWYEESPAYNGRFVSFSGVDAHPRPVQRPIPVVVGGRTPVAYRRAVRCGHGWYGFAQTPETARAAIDGLRSASQAADRPPELGELEITVTPRGRMTRETATAFAEAGVHRIVPVIYPPTADGISRTIDMAVEATSDL